MWGSLLGPGGCPVADEEHVTHDKSVCFRTDETGNVQVLSSFGLLFQCYFPQRELALVQNKE